jgi:predicted ribosomally synthesized peptide with SipW-like signal peptide
MAYSRKVFTVGALGVAAFALIGTGASATFSDYAQAKQVITAGTMNMTITSTADGASGTRDGKTLTLKPYGPVGSTFSTGPQTITVSNNSNIDAKLVKLEVTAPTTNDQLRDGIYVRIQLAESKVVVYDGVLTDLESSASPLISGQTIKSGSSMSAVVTFYAGKEDNPALPNGAQGGVVVPTFSVSFDG